MRKLFVLFAVLLLTGNVFSQVFIAGGIGKSDKAFITELKVGFEKGFMVEGGMVTNITRMTDARIGSYFGADAGYAIPVGVFKITPSYGYYYRLVSTDKNYQNGYVHDLGVRLSVKSWYAAYHRMDGINFVTVGFLKFD